MNLQPPLPNNEIARLDALRQYQILDTAPEKVFDNFTFLAAQICQTPIALISLIDGNRQWFKSKVGLSAPETSRDVAFCAYTIVQNRPMVVRNALADYRFADNPLVTSDPNIRFYAGAPLVTPEGFAIGTLCVIDIVPRDLSLEQVEALRVLSDQAIAQFELRRNVISMSRNIIQRQQAAAKRSRQQEFVEVFYHRGVDKAVQGNFKGAIADFNQYLQINPNGIKAYYQRGIACRQIGDYKRAMADFDEYLRHNPNDAEAHCNRGLVRAELGDYKGAIADYTVAMRINPDCAVAYSDQGLADFEPGDSQELIVNYTQSLPYSLDDAEVDVSKQYSGSYIEDYKQAIQDYTQPLSSRLNDAEVVVSSVNSSSYIEDYNAAIEDYTYYLRLNPDDAEAYLNRGAARYQLKDYDGAIEDYTHYLRLNPNDPKVYISRGAARSKLKDYNGAMEDYKKARDISKSIAF